METWLKVIVNSDKYRDYEGRAADVKVFKPIKRSIESMHSIKALSPPQIILMPRRAQSRFPLTVSLKCSSYMLSHGTTPPYNFEVM